MIKTGVIGEATARTARLLRLLLHHPDVSLRWVTDATRAGRSVSEVFLTLSGDTDLAFSAHPDWEGTDVVFVCTDSYSVQALTDTAPQQVCIIDLSPWRRLVDESASGYAYGMSEVNRRRMVHDCYRVSCPGAVAMALSLALLPLAKNLMLNHDIHATIVTGNNSTLPITDTSSPAIINPAEEVRRVIEALQTSFSSPIHLTTIDGALPYGMMATAHFRCGVDAGMVRQLFEQYYDDHNFVFLVDRKPQVCDVVGTNKCLLHLEREGDCLRVTSVIDDDLKGSVGTAVHAMNLMFGLHERIGLQL